MPFSVLESYYKMKGISFLENRQLLGAVNGIDVLLQCLSVSYISKPVIKVGGLLNRHLPLAVLQ